MSADLPPPTPADCRPADFGFADVAAAEKDALVGGVFSQVAPYYDRMNDVMSFGLHRLWKRAAVQLLAVRPNKRVLDLACGSGDLSVLLRRRLAAGLLVAADINADMLALGRRRLQESPTAAAPLAVQCDAQSLPFADGAFDRVICAFGLRNTTCRLTALREMRRVLRPGGLCVILEFSPPRGWLRAVRHYHLTAGLPLLGKLFFGDESSYRYLGESIVRFPPPEQLRDMMHDAGLARVQDIALPGGAAWVHRGWRLE